VQWVEGRWVYSATDLNNFLECEHLITLEHRAALGEIARPPKPEYAEILANRGLEHEKRHLERLHSENGGSIVTIADIPPGAETISALQQAELETIAAMESDAKTIYQAKFFDGTFRGYADFLMRVDKPSPRFGSYSYEPVDTKLALNVKPYYIIQLCNYSEHLARVQGVAPENIHIVLGDGTVKSFHLAEFDAYYRHIKASFLKRMESNGAVQTYPIEIKHCTICRWNEVCEQQRHADDHLTLVARIRNDQITKLNAAGIHTVEDLARATDEQKPFGMNPDTFATLRRQARLQLEGRLQQKPLYKLLQHEQWEGFGLMPEPAPGDVFFDMEGDPLYEPGRGLEYLFGVWLSDGAHDDVMVMDRTMTSNNYLCFRALSRTEEKRAFEAFIDFIIARRKQYPKMHIYHYANYEKAALRRLAQEHGTREEEVDDLLHGEVLVDLFAVVRQAVVISASGYSLKKVEPVYRMVRETQVRGGEESIVEFEKWLAESDEAKKRAILDDIERYNEDDCRSTLLLRDWLLERRLEAIGKFGVEIPFKPLKDPKEPCHPEVIEGCKKCDQRLRDEREEARASELQKQLLKGLEALGPHSTDEYERLTEPDRTRYLLGNSLAYHRRDEKPPWWQFYHRCENSDELLEFDKDAIACLELRTEREFAPYKNSPQDKNLVYTYEFPDQHYKIGAGDKVTDPATQKSAGEIISIEEGPERNLLRIKRGGTMEDAARLKALIPSGPPGTKEQRASLRRIADSYLKGTLSDRHPAILDLLNRHPRVVMVSSRGAAQSNHRTTTRVQPSIVNEHTISTIAQSLENSYLFIQGPPGTGKTWKGARVICDLLAAGKRVGVLSNSHKAIHHLLHNVEECADKRGMRFTGLYKHSESNEGSRYDSKLPTPMIASTSSNADLEAGDYQLAGGTSWLFAREPLTNAFDYLFIDEAGQISLADAIAASACARNIVLLGDPLQLAQVSQGIHPFGVGASVLEHLLGEHPTIPPERGIFLDVSRRMHPEICSFISEAVYEGRLHAMPGTELQRVDSAGLSGSGLRYIPMEHTGNSRESIEEAQRFRDEILLLLGGTVTDDKDHPRPLRSKDIIVVTPYNAQRRLILTKLRDAGIEDIRVGTVDKFQGQEAFVVFYSMATSSGADIPRTVDFLFEKNRFNVAISRARALSVLIASDRLADVRCSTPEQISTIDLLCRYIEAADNLTPVGSLTAPA